jgi:hypothetical protein
MGRHVARRGEIRNAYKISVNIQGRDHLKDLVVAVRII